MRVFILRNLFVTLLLLVAVAVPGRCEEAAEKEEEDDDDEWANLSPEEYLALGEQAILEEDDLVAIELLNRGLEALAEAEDRSLLTGLTLETNLAEVYASVQDHETSFEHYESAIEAFGTAVATGAIVLAADEDDGDDGGGVGVGGGAVDEATVMASRAMMSYAFELQEFDDDDKTLDLYQKAVATNPGLWLGWAKMGAFFCGVRGFLRWCFRPMDGWMNGSLPN